MIPCHRLAQFCNYENDDFHQVKNGARLAQILSNSLDGLILNEPSTLVFLGHALALGLRHGLDVDHVAAILDIVGASNNNDSLLKSSSRPLIACLFYACGHALAVIVLGVVAITFSYTLPAWVDPIAERVVGLTLLLLGFSVLYSVIRQMMQGEADISYQSRGKLVLSLLESLRESLKDLIFVPAGNGQFSPQRGGIYTSNAAFAIGVLHGIGAETGSQILLLTAVASTNRSLGALMLVMFVVGLITCNMIVALLGNVGFASALQKRTKAVIIALGLSTAIFSLATGVIFSLGANDRLPELGTMFRPGLIFFVGERYVH